jgi:hypothetical protein
MPYGSGTVVSCSVTEAEQRPPIWSRFMAVLTWPLATRPLIGRASDPQVTVPDALNGPTGKPGKATTTLPAFGSGPTAPAAWARNPAGHGIVLENARPVIVTAADGWPTGVTTTVGTYDLFAARPGTVTEAAEVGPTVWPPTL